MPWQLSNLTGERLKFLAGLLGGEAMGSLCRRAPVTQLKYLTK
jgi:hypothetical protein